MDVYVSTAVAEGGTELAAFDACLLKVGVGNFNLLYLSSVIPPDVVIRREDAPASIGSWGDRLYCVIAEQRTSRIGHEIWAGIGWAQQVQGNQGVFAEAIGATEGEVELQLKWTLAEMTARRKDGDWRDPEFALVGSTCSGAPICALAVATYKSEGWS
jgi:arginine decarboxylase